MKAEQALHISLAALGFISVLVCIVAKGELLLLAFNTFFMCFNIYFGLRTKDTL